MEHIQIRACMPTDIDAGMALERLWESEAIAFGDFNWCSMEECGGAAKARRQNVRRRARRHDA